MRRLAAAEPGASPVAGKGANDLAATKQTQLSGPRLDAFGKPGSLPAGFALESSPGLKGKNAPVARFDGLCCYQNKSKKLTGAGSLARCGVPCGCQTGRKACRPPCGERPSIFTDFATALIAAKPVKPCDGGLFGA